MTYLMRSHSVYLLIIELDLTGAVVHPRDDVEQRGLARSVWPGETECFALPQIERNVAQRAKFAEVLADFAKFQYWHGTENGAGIRGCPLRLPLPTAL